MINIALRAARIAGENIIRSTDRIELIKSSNNDIYELIDELCKKTESSIAYSIQKAYPEHQVEGKYAGIQLGKIEKPDYIWKINSIDNLDNFSAGIPLFALSIACFKKGKPEHALVLNPVTGEEFTTSRGHGSQLNGKRLRVKQHKQIKNALLGVKLPENAGTEQAQKYFDILNKILRAEGKYFDSKSTAISMAYTAAGRLDGFYQSKSTSWERDAGILLIQEAGGLISDLNGGNQFNDQGGLVAGNPKILKALIKLTLDSSTAG